MQCVILAGGLATRMYPLTEATPKFLIPIEDEPFANYQLNLLAQNGVKEVLICIGYLGTKIREYVGDGSKWGLAVDYVDEGQELRGTAGALRLALDQGKLSSEFMTIYGDSYLPIHFPEVWSAFRQSLKTGCTVLMTVIENAHEWDRSNARYENGKVTLYTKTESLNSELRFIDYGLSVFQSKVIEKRVAPNIKTDLAEVFSALSQLGQLAGHLVAQRFYEIGSPEGLESFRKLLSSKT